MLSVKIHSFSYKKSGIPKDDSLNGGGFVFDCRFVDNPGRIPEFKNLSGTDAAVIEFLGGNEEMQELLRNVQEIICNAVENYIERDFTDLMVSFGCTGGQHRSVYAAEKLKNFLEHKYDGKILTKVSHNDITIS